MRADEAEARWIVMSGDPGGGFMFHGPFTHDDAVLWAERACKNVTGWYVCELHPVTAKED